MSMRNLTKDATLPASCKLPLELTDRIVDFLHDDKAALRACSLIGRTFLKRSRYHRFHFVSLNQRTGEAFEALLNTSSDIGAYVRELHVSVSTFECTPTWVEVILPRIARELPNVVTLHMRGNGEYKAAPFRSLTSVRELCLTHCEMYSMNEFVSIIGAFPALESLCLRDVLIGRSPTLTPNPPALKRAPRCLEFSSSRLDGPMLVDWFLDHNLLEVESLTLVPLQRVSLVSVGKYLQAAGPSIKYLKLAMVTLKSDADFASHLRSALKISSLPNLQCIEFGSPALYATQYGADELSFEWIFQLLDDISSPIEVLVFSLWEGDQEAVTGWDWVRIADVLKLSRFSSLKKIKFHVWGRPTPCKIMTESVKANLAVLDEKGLLQFDSIPDPEY